MEAAVAARVCVHLDAVLGDTGMFPIGYFALGEVVGIDKILSL